MEINDESIKNKVREIQSKYCGESVETKLYYAIKETRDAKLGQDASCVTDEAKKWKIYWERRREEENKKESNEDEKS